LTPKICEPQQSRRKEVRREQERSSREGKRRSRRHQREAVCAQSGAQKAHNTSTHQEHKGEPSPAVWGHPGMAARRRHSRPAGSGLQPTIRPAIRSRHSRSRWLMSQPGASRVPLPTSRCQVVKSGSQPECVNFVRNYFGFERNRSVIPCSLATFLAVPTKYAALELSMRPSRSASLALPTNPHVTS
jgi:hypothetical protein